MLGVPDRYRIDKPLALKTFLTAAPTPPDRKRLTAALRSVVLRDQIAGEDIPSRVDDGYNCQTIQTLTMQLHGMAGAGTLAALLQQMIKPLCLLEMTDGQTVRYAFATKRLNQNDPGAVVVEDAHLTPAFPTTVAGAKRTAFEVAADFGALRNRTDKLAVYREWSARAFLATRGGLFSGTARLLASAGWYREGFAEAVFADYVRLERLSEERGRAERLKEQARINGEARKILDRLERMAEGAES